MDRSLLEMTEERRKGAYSEGEITRGKQLNYNNWRVQAYPNSSIHPFLPPPATQPKQSTYPIQSILKNQALFWQYPHPLGRRQVNVGGGLALFDLKKEKKM